MSFNLLKKTAVLLCAVFSISSACIKADIVPVKADISALYGDVNGDGQVNIIDSIYMKQYALGVSTDFPVTNWRSAAGVAGTGNISGNDITVHKEQLLRLDDIIYPLKKISVYNGIDVSYWQGDVDWKKARAAGIDFVMIKAGEGTQVEPNFIKNITGAKNAGIQCGVYWFSNARNIEDCHKEAQACLNTIKGYQLEYPVVYDFEYRTVELPNNPLKYDRNKCTEVIYTFLSDIESAGYYAMIYSNKDFPQRYLNIKTLTDRFDFWYANYSISEPDVSCGIWQKSCTGRVNGISTDVDLDVSYVNYKAIMVKNGVNGFPKITVE